MKDEKSQIKLFDDETSTLLEYILGVLENSNCKNFATIDINNESYNELCEKLHTTNEDIISNYIVGKLSSMVD